MPTISSVFWLHQHLHTVSLHRHILSMYPFLTITAMCISAPSAGSKHGGISRSVHMSLRSQYLRPSGPLRVQVFAKRAQSSLQGEGERCFKV